MKLTGHACTGALSEAEEDGTRERAEDNAGGVRVERRVRLPGRSKGQWRDGNAVAIEPGEEVFRLTGIGQVNRLAILKVVPG